MMERHILDAAADAYVIIESMAAYFVQEYDVSCAADPAAYERDFAERIAAKVPMAFGITGIYAVAILTDLILRAVRGKAEQAALALMNDWRDAE